MKSKEEKTLYETVNEIVVNAGPEPMQLTTEAMSGLKKKRLKYQGAAGKDSYGIRDRAELLATLLAQNINNMPVPDSDSVVYENPNRDYKKENAAATKYLENIIKQIEVVSKLVARGTSLSWQK